MRGSSTLREVAERAGVAPPTASRVLNNDPSVRVRAETRQRILDTAQDLGYTPNSVARSLRGSRSGALGLIMHGLDSPINVRVLDGARSRCAEAGYVTLLADADELAVDHSRLRAFLARGRLDGVILHTGYGHVDRLVEEIAGVIPAVLVNSDDGKLAPAVRLDDAAAGATATEHLVALGHDRIVFFGGAEDSPSSARREAGYREVVTQRCGPAGIDVVPAGWTADRGASATRALLRRDDLPTAIVVANAVTAAGVLSTLRGAGVAVPQDVSVVAIHDPWFVAHLPVALTTVRMALFELGVTAAGMLIESLDDRRHVTDTFIDHPSPELIERASTGPPPTRAIRAP